METLSITILPQGLVLVLKLYFTEPGSVQMLNKEMVHSTKQVVSKLSEKPVKLFLRKR